MKPGLTAKSAIDRFFPDFWCNPADVLLRASEVVIWSRQKLEAPILDIGCGDGSTGARLFAGRKIDMGIDLVGSDIPLAQACGVYKKAIQADAAHMPFKNASFATVTCNSTIEHIEKDIKAISEFSRVLKPNGRLLITTTSTRLLETLKQLLTPDEVEKLNNRLAHFHYRSKDEWRKILRKHGLTMVEHHYYLPPEKIAAWLKIFKISTARIYHRELWSYLRDSPYGKLAPKNLITRFLKFYLPKHIATDFSENGTWQYIIARKS